jgi:hypothetical protein
VTAAKNAIVHPLIAATSAARRTFFARTRASAITVKCSAASGPGAAVTAEVIGAA